MECLKPLKEEKKREMLTEREELTLKTGELKSTEHIIPILSYWDMETKLAKFYGAKHFGIFWFCYNPLSSHYGLKFTCGRSFLDGIHLHRNFTTTHLFKGPYKLCPCALTGGMIAA
ncbi:unnamed protein product [Dovyalis caffra]|uniref:Uncharacterized protein n=1 Tax=Dovyalis caffra TaxID=77055 RepID=A0AAV1RVM8_9ROSI|nr:unnamed protein product [Dovyalis caffra]